MSKEKIKQIRDRGIRIAKEKFNCRVEFCNIDFDKFKVKDGYYNTSINVIGVDSGLNKIDQCIILYHELGHCMSYNHIKVCGDEHRQSHNQWKIDGPIKKTDFQNVLYDEMMAWQNAEELLRETKFDKWKEFRNKKYKSINSYMYEGINIKTIY